MKNLLKIEEYEELLTKPKVLLVFSAGWCGHCITFKPTLASFEKQHGKDIETVIIDIDDFENLADKYDIMSIPSLVLLENGIVAKQNVGGLSENVLAKFAGLVK